MNKIYTYLSLETKRQNKGLELIASENYVSKKIRKLCGSILTNKYAEGYPNKRYYGGCKYIDKIEQYAIDKACELFKCKYANVQPHSGSQANAAAYRALEKYLKLDRKMKILTMNLNSGSHLSHGSKVSFSSNLYDFDFFDLNNNGKIDFDIVEEKIKSFNPDVILSGYSAYPYKIDFRKFKELANKYNCLFMVDMAHIAGLVCSKNHMSPIPYADIVTTTTHKTLRGPRGGLILTNNEELYKLINSAVFPYYQGGPLEHIIAAKALCFDEALNPKFKEYIDNVILNTKTFTNKMKELGATCSNTNNHLMLLNTKKSFNLTGKESQKLLEEINITTNKNMLPNDTESPQITSGLRIGFAALTTRGLNEQQASLIADIIYYYLSKKISKTKALKQVKEISKSLKKIEEI